MTQNESDQALNSVLKGNRANDLLTVTGSWFANERLIITVVLLLLLFFSGFDFFEDRAEGAERWALIADLTDVLLPAALLIYLWRLTPLARMRQNQELKSAILAQRKDVEHWKSQAAVHLQGLGETINEQFDAWGLSTAEKQVALLLLKGLSLREIAAARGVSERTVRQQATRLYDKASLRGRAELSAFFLEDLMLPTL